MPAPQQTKKQRIEEARQAARAAREKRERRQRLWRTLTPILVVVVILVVVGGVIAGVAAWNSAHRAAPSYPGGPKNMQSDGLLFEGAHGTASYVPTPALGKGQKPKEPRFTGAEAKLPHVVTYVDLGCPGCKQFESSYAKKLRAEVVAGKITLEIRPVAILDHNYTTDYSTRADNLVASIAANDPAHFLDAVAALYDQQATEGSDGLSDEKMLSIVHGAGVKSGDVDAAVRGRSYVKWVRAATTRATSNTALQQEVQGQMTFSTPTALVDGHLWKQDSNPDFMAFVAAKGAAQG